MSMLKFLDVYYDVINACVKNLYFPSIRTLARTRNEPSAAEDNFELLGPPVPLETC